MNPKDIAKKNVEISKFQKIVQFLIAVLFVPILLVSAFSIYIYSSTKSNSDLPSGFGFHVMEVPEDIDEFASGQKVVVKDIDTKTIAVNDYVAFYVASEEPTEEGSKIAFKKVLEVIEDNGVRRFRFANEMYYQIEDAVIGIYNNESAILISIFSFFSNSLVIIFLCLIPLLFILLLLGLYIIEQLSVNKLNNDIKLALAKAESAGFDINLEEAKQETLTTEKVKELPVEQEQEFQKPLLPPKKAPSAHIKAKMPPRKAPVSVMSVEQPKTPSLPNKAPKAPLPPKKAPLGSLPPKKDNK